MPAPRGLVQQLDQFLHRTALLAPRQRLLIACSGGADSIALLRLLVAVNRSNYWQWKLVVAHVNHGLRGRHSVADECFVKRTAREMGLPCVVRKVSLKKRPGDHISEAAAREARLQALHALARQRRCTAIVLAHHADDQAETVLLRILRGCSIAGLAAMRPRRRVGAIHVVRPLLTFERATLLKYLGEIGQPWREDHTNALPLYLRNRIRHELLPQLAACQPAIRRLLVRLAAQARESARAHRHAVAALLAHVAIGRTGATLSRTPLQAQPPLVLGMLIRSVIKRLGGPLDQITAEALGRAATALGQGVSGQQIQLGGFSLHLQKTTAILRRSGKRS